MLAVMRNFRPSPDPTAGTRTVPSQFDTMCKQFRHNAPIEICSKIIYTTPGSRSRKEIHRSTPQRLFDGTFYEYYQDSHGIPGEG